MNTIIPDSEGYTKFGSDRILLGKDFVSIRSPDTDKYYLNAHIEAQKDKMTPDKIEAYHKARETNSELSKENNLPEYQFDVFADGTVKLSMLPHDLISSQQRETINKRLSEQEKTPSVMNAVCKSVSEALREIKGFGLEQYFENEKNKQNELKIARDLYEAYDSNEQHYELRHASHNEAKTTEQLHADNVEFIKWFLEHKTKPEDILKIVPMAEKHLQEALIEETGKTAEKPITNKNFNSKEKKTMANWTNPSTSKQNNEEQLAYINKETYELGKVNPEIKGIADNLLAKAKEIMESVKEAGLTTQSVTRDGKTTYTDKMVVNVERALKWDKETQSEMPVTTKDGNPVYQATAELKHNGTTVTLFANKDGDLSAMTASKWNRSKDATPKLMLYKQDEIATAPINRDMKAIANHIQESGFIQGKDSKENALYSFCVEANQYFTANSDKVANDKGEIVNNAYAQYKNDEYGEKVTIYNHTDNVAVELGNTRDGSPYAVAINYDLNKEFEPRKEGEAPAKAFINNKEDLEQFIEQPEVKDMVADFKKIDLSAEKEKGNVKETKLQKD